MSLVVNPAGLAAGDAYGDVTGTKIDTSRDGGAVGAEALSYVCGATAFGVTFKVVGSNDDTTYFDIKSVDEHGTQAAAADVAVAAAAFKVLGVPRTGARFRFYKVQQKNTVGGSVGTGTVVGFAK